MLARGRPNSTETCGQAEAVQGPGIDIDIFIFLVLILIMICIFLYSAFILALVLIFVMVVHVQYDEWGNRLSRTLLNTQHLLDTGVANGHDHCLHHHTFITLLS